MRQDASAVVVKRFQPLCAILVIVCPVIFCSCSNQADLDKAKGEAVKAQAEAAKARAEADAAKAEADAVKARGEADAAKAQADAAKVRAEADAANARKTSENDSNLAARLMGKWERPALGLLDSSKLVQFMADGMYIENLHTQQVKWSVKDGKLAFSDGLTLFTHEFTLSPDNNTLTWGGTVYQRKH